MPGIRVPRRRRTTVPRSELDADRVVIDAMRRLGFDPWSGFPPVLRVGHVAQIFGVRPGSVSEAARLGRIPMRKRLGKWVIEQAALRAWVAGLDAVAQAPSAAPAGGGRR